MVTSQRSSAAAIDHGVSVTISDDGVLHADDKALQTLLADADSGVSVTAGRVYACGPAAKRLQRALARLRRDSKPLTIVFPEREMRGALILELYVMGGAARLGGTFRRAASNNLPSGERIGEALGLSPAEAALALALARGVSPDDHALAQRVSKNTVRSQLAVIRRKTGAHSQTQIANLIWLLASARV